MKIKTYQSNYTHPLDVLTFITQAQDHEDCALVVVTGTDGGGVRAPGALMAVTRSGKAAGYVSNGCVDGDVILNAQQAISQNKPVELRYGKDSPFFDIKLPCGGSLDLLIAPNPDSKLIALAEKKLRQRRPLMLLFNPDGSLSVDDNQTDKTGWRDKAFLGGYFPKPKLRVIGRGAEPLALARLGLSCDMDVLLQSPNKSVIAHAKTFGAKAELVQLGQDLKSQDDPWTACILMFHDHDWEYDILIQALKHKAFYIGALGSLKTHNIRCDILRAQGVSEPDINRIRAPIGLIPSMRDASMLAISTLADVAGAYQEAIK